MSRRESFKQQDAEGTTSETAVQVRPSRSILKSLVVQAVAPGVVEPVIEREHYLHSMPAVTRACLGVYLGEDLVGAAVFTSGPRQGYRFLTAADPRQVVTLARLWVSDALPKNAESRIIGVLLRTLRRGKQWKLVLSYADPMAGHVGTIYQATGWTYLGQTPPDTYIDLGNGRLHHPRSVYERFGSNNVRHLRATGIAARRIRVAGKHRYAYVLDRAWAWRLRAGAWPYPRNRDG